MEKKSDNRVCMDNKAGFENSNILSGPKPAITNPPLSQPDLSPSGQVCGRIGRAEPGRCVLISVPYLQCITFRRSPFYSQL
jgi:hypothetical protein